MNQLAPLPANYQDVVFNNACDGVSPTTDIPSHFSQQATQLARAFFDEPSIVSSLSLAGFAALDRITPDQHRNTPVCDKLRAAAKRDQLFDRQFEDLLAAVEEPMRDYWNPPAKPATMAPAAKLEAGITMATGLVGSIGDSLTGSKPAPSAPSSAMDKLAGSSVEMGSLSKSFDATATPQKLDPIAKAYADLRSKDKKPGNDLA